MKNSDAESTSFIHLSEVNVPSIMYFTAKNALSDVDDDDSDDDGTPDDGNANNRKKRRSRKKCLRITFPENSLVKRIAVNECLELLL